MALRTSCGAAVLLGSGPKQPEPRSQLLLTARLGLALGRRIVRGVRVGAALERLRADEPHGYVAILGTRPDAQGRGYASALLRTQAAGCDALRVPLRLETANERNLSFYLRHGFAIAAQAEAVGGGPRVWALLRSPGAGA